MGLQAVSCSPRLRIDIRAGQRNFTQKGDELPESRELFVQFYPGGNVPDYARSLVEQLPGFRQGIGRDEDPHVTRLGWWDSVAAQADYDWTDEERKYVEETFLRKGDPNVVVLHEPVVASPYERYETHRKVQGKRTLEHVFADIQATYDLAGFDVNQAVAFEKQNGGNAKVVEFLSGLGAAVSEESDELVAA